MSKNYQLDDSMVEELTRLKYCLDVDSESRVIRRAIALLKLLEKEKDRDGYIHFLDGDGDLNKVKIVGQLR